MRRNSRILSYTHIMKCLFKVEDFSKLRTLQVYVSQEGEDFDVLHCNLKNKKECLFMNTSYIISIINTTFVAEGWYHCLVKNPNVYSVITNGVSCTCTPQCMEILLDTFFKFLLYSFCNCWSEGMSGRHWHLLERWIGCYISCFLRNSYVIL